MSPSARAPLRLVALSLAALFGAGPAALLIAEEAAQPTPPPKAPAPPAPPPMPSPQAAEALRQELKACPHKILYVSRRDGNWELYRMNADGSDPMNLTRTPDLDEVYPKISPDGARICCVVDEGKGDARRRNLYVMDADGTGRAKIADNAREPCWSPDGTAIAYLKGEFDNFDAADFATRGLFIYDLKTGKHREHPNKDILHLFTPNWSPDGKWFVATVHGGMGFSHGILAIEAEGLTIVNLKLRGCRPDLSVDAKKVVWGNGDFAIGLADLDLSAPTPVATHMRNVVPSREPIETYHADLSPDARYIAFTRGPKGKGKGLLGLANEVPGEEAPGWDICVADASKTNVWVAITHDGKSNKEPDWVAAKGDGAK